MFMPKPAQAAVPKETNVVCLDVARLEREQRAVTSSPYDQALRQSLQRGERNFFTAQQAYKEFSAAAEVVMWDIEQLLKPAYDAVAQYLSEMDELDQDALLVVANKDDARAILLLQGMGKFSKAELPATSELLKAIKT